MATCFLIFWDAVRFYSELTIYPVILMAIKGIFHRFLELNNKADATVSTLNPNL